MSTGSIINLDNEEYMLEKSKPEIKRRPIIRKPNGGKPTTIDKTIKRQTTPIKLSDEERNTIFNHYESIQYFVEDSVAKLVDQELEVL